MDLVRSGSSPQLRSSVSCSSTPHAEDTPLCNPGQAPVARRHPAERPREQSLASDTEIVKDGAVLGLTMSKFPERSDCSTTTAVAPTRYSLLVGLVDEAEMFLFMPI